MFVDTAPVMEKPLAEAAGLGWQGKHTRAGQPRVRLVAVSRRDPHRAPSCPYDAPHEESCGTCSQVPRCLPDQRVPGAVPARCAAVHRLSHIEHQGPIPHEFRARDGQPHLWLRRLPRGLPVEQVRAGEPRGEAAGARRARRPLPWAISSALDDAGFRTLFAGSPVKRLGHARFLRNVLIAIGNSGDPALLPAAEARLDDADPLVRGAAVWAVRRLDPGRMRFALAVLTPRRHGRAAEWTAAGHPLMDVFFFGMGYSSLAAARAIHAGIDRDVPIAGTTRTDRWRRAARRHDLPGPPLRRRRARADACATICAGQRMSCSRSRRTKRAIPALQPSPRRSRCGAEPRVALLFFDRRRLWRFRRRLDRRDAPTTRPINQRSKLRVAVEQQWRDYRRRARRAAADPPARRHLWAGPLDLRQAARRGRAAHRQAGPGVQPHPCRGHRPDHAARGAARSSRAPSISPTTSRRRRRTS